MSITINGTTGIAGVDGTASAPAVQGADSNTGVFFPAADTVAVTTGGTERMRVDSSGTISAGSGTTNINYNIGGQIQMPAATTETRSIDIGVGRTGNGYAHIDFIGDATYTDFGLRIIRNDTGANASSEISHRGTGGLILTAFDNSFIYLQTNATVRFVVGSAGQLGIGGANYGTSGQVLTSGGSGAAPSWTSRGFASATLTDKTSVRANGTTYQNTTTGWLFVSVRDSNNGQAFTAGPSSASLNIFNTNIAPGTAIALVPPSYYYACSGSVLQSWYEGQA